MRLLKTVLAGGVVTAVLAAIAILPARATEPDSAGGGGIAAS
jgi:hypothetical protein